MVSVPPSPVPGNTPLPDTRSVSKRAYRCDRLPPGTVRLTDGTPADAVVTIRKGKAECRYLVAVTGWTHAEGVHTRWQKPDQTLDTCTYGGFAATCDCPACCWEATQRADRRHRDTRGSYGCTKLDTLAELVLNKLLPDPRANPEADAAAHPGERADQHPEPCDPPFVCTCGRCR